VPFTDKAVNRQRRLKLADHTRLHFAKRREGIEGAARMEAASTSAQTSPRPISLPSDSQPSTAKTPASQPHDTAVGGIGAQATTAERLAARDVSSLSGPTAGEKLAGQATTADRLAGRAAPSGEAGAAAPTTTAADTPPSALIGAKREPDAPPSLDKQIKDAREADKAVEKAKNAALDPKIQAAVVADLQAKADKLWGDVFKQAQAADKAVEKAKNAALDPKIQAAVVADLQAKADKLWGDVYKAAAKDGDIATIQRVFEARLADTPPSQRSAVINATIAGLAPLLPAGTPLGPFKTEDEAAVAMMTYSNPLSKAANLENGGLVLRDDETGLYYVTTPSPGTLDGFNPAGVTVPEGMTSVGAYHGHADYSLKDGTRTDKAHDEFNSDQFSDQDKRVADGGFYGPKIWVSTPSGDFREYDSATGTDTKIN
jgi:Domain of unknown function (DUF4329)